MQSVMGITRWHHELAFQIKTMRIALHHSILEATVAGPRLHSLSCNFIIAWSAMWFMWWTNGSDSNDQYNLVQLLGETVQSTDVIICTPSIWRPLGAFICQGVNSDISLYLSRLLTNGLNPTMWHCLIAFTNMQPTVLSQPQNLTPRNLINGKLPSLSLRFHCLQNFYLPSEPNASRIKLFLLSCATTLDLFYQI